MKIMPQRTTNTSNTSPDISLVSNSLLASSNWKVVTKISSDHLPILIDLSANISKKKSQDKKYINFSKANWAKFTEDTEKIFSEAYHTEDVHEDERFFRKTIQNAAKNYIPSGRIMRTIHEIPTEALNDITKRDRLRNEDPTNPRLPELNRDINKKINIHKQQKWKEHLSKCQPNSKKNYGQPSKISIVNPNNQKTKVSNLTTRCITTLNN